MANYSVNNFMVATPSLQNVGAAYKTLLESHAVTANLRRFCWYEFEFGINAAPGGTDGSLEWAIAKTTAAGTPNAAPAVPIALDPADVTAAVTVVGINHTAEPTYTAANTFWALGANQRASYRWIARDDKSALWCAAVNLNGLALMVRNAAGTYTSTALASVFFQEQ